MGFLAFVFFVAVIVLLILNSKVRQQLNITKKKFEKYQPIIDKYDTIELLEKDVKQATAELALIRTRITESTKEQQTTQQLLDIVTAQLQEYKGQDDLVMMGFYNPHYHFDDSESYKNRLAEIRERQKQLAKDNKAVLSKTTWTIGGKQKEGEKLTGNIIKLMVRAFNGECDAMIEEVKFSNVVKYEEKIQRSKQSIDKLTDFFGCSITDEYMNLKIEELRLVYEYVEKKEAEKEEQRQIKEQMREEEKVRRELEKAQEDAAKEEKRYQEALDKARKEMENASGAELQSMNEKIAELQRLLDNAHTQKERALSQAQLTKSGFVYVISNIGSFGENVFKIGMTRRLEPMDRVKELGDASVPFDFDVHAMIFSENAPELENQLHKRFNNLRVNQVNTKKEFFKVPLTDIESAVKQVMPVAEFTFTLLAEAKEFRETIAKMNSNN